MWGAVAWRSRLFCMYERVLCSFSIVRGNFGWVRMQVTGSGVSG